MRTLMTLKNRAVLIPLALSLIAPFLWIATLTGGNEYDAYARRVVEEEAVLTMVIPGMALWSGAIALALTYWPTRKATGMWCSTAWATLVGLFGGFVIGVIALCSKPNEGSIGDIFSWAPTHADDTMRAGLVAAGVLFGLAASGWIHYGLIRGSKHYDATRNPDGTIRQDVWPD